MPTAARPQPLVDRRTSRRGLLRLGFAGAVLGPALTGCGRLGAIRWDDDEPPAPPVPGPDDLARRRAVASALALQATCEALASARPEGAATFTELSGQHGEHLRALGETSRATGTEQPDDSAEPTATSVPTAPTPGSDPVADAVTQHTAAASEAMTDAMGTSGPVARLLARVAAARAVQAVTVAAALQVDAPPPPVPVVAPSSTDGDLTGTPTTTSGEPVPNAAVPDTTADALTAAVEGEHAARYGFELVATRLEGPERDRALLAVAARTATAERLSAALAAAGRRPPVPAPGYRLPGPVPDAAAARALAVQLDTALTALGADLVARCEGELRAVAVDLVVHRALDAHSWGAAPAALPGA